MDSSAFRSVLRQASIGREGKSYLTVGPLRFAKPISASSWEGVRNVTVKGDACPAVAELTYKRPEGGPMSEDCLHTYVYASKHCLTKGGCAIMWVVHGGRYNFESPVVFVNDVIVHNFASDGQDVVVIIPAYRLENFGFLNIAPGMKTSATPNTAVWDLLLALQWTQLEAHHFGGDPDKITVFGHSAGAQFADIISVSPHFKGLFNGIILMSGMLSSVYEAGYKSNSLASWVTATILGCATDATDRSDVVAVEAVMACMRAKTWQDIVEANEALNTRPEDYHGPHADGPGGILPLPPSQLARTRPAMRVMLGTTAAEFHDTKYALNADGTVDMKKVTELCEGFAYSIGYAHPDVMTKLCIDYYMQVRNVINLQQDAMFFMPNYLTARDLAEMGNEVFLYSFTYKGIEGAFKKFSPLDDKDDHPSHAEDYVYVLGMHRGNFTPRDYEIEKIYSGMVLNFVKTGNPNLGTSQPDWKSFRKLGGEYYENDFDDANRMPGMKKHYQAGAVKLWVYEAEKYGGPITPPELPAGADRFWPMDMVNAYASHHASVNFAHDKTIAAEEEQYKIWTDYINDRRFKNLQDINSFRSIASEQPNLAGVAQPQRSISLEEILVICVSVVFIFLLLRCCLRCVGVRQERKGYEEF